MTQLHPVKTGRDPPTLDPSALFSPLTGDPGYDFIVAPFFPLCLSKFSGRTATLIGVGCVLNTGTPALSSDFESGDNMPFPMHISLIFSPLEHGGISSKQFSSMMLFSWSCKST